MLASWNNNLVEVHSAVGTMATSKIICNTLSNLIQIYKITDIFCILET